MNTDTNKRNVGICHYRVGKTDGVSLEIMKREKVLKEMGYRSKLIAGEQNNGAHYTIPELDLEQPMVVKIRENAFFQFSDYTHEEELLRDINHIAASIEHQFLQIHKKEQFDCLFIHNILSHALHIAAAKAFYAVAKNTDIKIIAFHHDFRWDGTNQQLYQPTRQSIVRLVEKYLPPNLPNISHVTINSIDQRYLKEDKGISSTLVPDMFDFEQPAWVPDRYNQTFLDDVGFRKNDLIVLQATRIVERKAIELAIDFVQELSTRKGELVGNKLYNGKTLTRDSNIVLLLAGYTEEWAQSYRRRLEDHIKQTGINAAFVDAHVNTWRKKSNGAKVYSLWDTYVYADLITYPSIWEGWGNQFIEAIFAKKPIAVFEYPVFKTDIKPEGYTIISLGDCLGQDLDNRLVQISQTRLTAAADQAIQMLTDPQTVDTLERNFNIGKQYHDDRVLKTLLRKLLSK